MLLRKTILISILGISFIFSESCRKIDTISPFISINEDSTLHYFGNTYIDAGAEAIDNQNCDITDKITFMSNVNIYAFGTYQVTYFVSDVAGNSDSADRFIDIILQKENLYSLSYQATDSCTSGTFSYIGYIQDCDCIENEVTVSNISNFGFSATFTLPIEGQFNEQILLDTIKNAVTFSGIGIMKPTADTLLWSYSISDSIATDICRSVWIKQ